MTVLYWHKRVGIRQVSGYTFFSFLLSYAPLLVLKLKSHLHMSYLLEFPILIAEWAVCVKSVSGYYFWWNRLGSTLTVYNIDKQREKKKLTMVTFRLPSCWNKRLYPLALATEKGKTRKKHLFWSDELLPCRGVPSVESSRSMQGLGKGVSGKPYPRLCNARRPRLEPGTFRSQAVRLYHLHQARPSTLAL